jgi:hypothetical protein
MSIAESGDLAGTEDVAASEDIAAADLSMPAARRRPSGRLRRIVGILLAVFTAQYIIVTIGTGLAIAGTLRYVVTPKIVATFETLAAALKH